MHTDFFPSFVLWSVPIGAICGSFNFLSYIVKVYHVVSGSERSWYDRLDMRDMATRWRLSQGCSSSILSLLLITLDHASAGGNRWVRGERWGLAEAISFLSVNSPRSRRPLRFKNFHFSFPHIGEESHGVKRGARNGIETSYWFSSICFVASISHTSCQAYAQH